MLIIRPPRDLHVAAAAKFHSVARVDVSEILPVLIEICEVCRPAAFLDRREPAGLDADRRDRRDRPIFGIDVAPVERRLHDRPIRANVFDWSIGTEDRRDDLDADREIHSVLSSWLSRRRSAIFAFCSSEASSMRATVTF